MTLHLGVIFGTVLLSLSGQTGPIRLSAEIGSSLVIPVSDDTFASQAAGFGGSATAEDPQRGQIVYSISSGRGAASTDLVTQATFLVPIDPSARLLDDPANARLYRGKIVSLVHVPANQGLTPGDYDLHARLVRGSAVTALDYNATVTLSASGSGRPASPAAAWNLLMGWLPAKATSTSPTGFDLSLAAPRPSLQLEWTWSGGPELRGAPPVLDDGVNKILGVQLVVHYPARLIHVARVLAPPGRELVIWSQDDHNGEVLIQAVSRDGLSVDRLEIPFELDGRRPLDPSDPIEGIRVDLMRAIDPRGYPADGGRTPPWSFAFGEVTVR